MPLSKRIHINLYVTSSKALVKVIDLACSDFPSLLYSNMDLKQKNYVGWNATEKEKREDLNSQF